MTIKQLRKLIKEELGKEPGNESWEAGVSDIINEKADEFVKALKINIPKIQDGDKRDELMFSVLSHMFEQFKTNYKVGNGAISFLKRYTSHFNK